MNRIILFTLFVIGLSACAHHDLEHQSIVVDVYPVQYQMSLFVDKKHLAKNELEWQRFYTDHHQTLLTRKVLFSYANAQGKKVASGWQSELIAGGAQQKNITIEKGVDMGEFDVKVEIVDFKVVTPICQPQQISGYAKTPIGCAVNSSLWQSLAYPQDALAQEK